jgi:hypothetical protein
VREDTAPKARFTRGSTISAQLTPIEFSSNTRWTRGSPLGADPGQGQTTLPLPPGPGRPGRGGLAGRADGENATRRLALRARASRERHSIGVVPRARFHTARSFSAIARTRQRAFTTAIRHARSISRAPVCARSTAGVRQRGIAAHARAVRIPRASSCARAVPRRARFLALGRASCRRARFLPRAPGSYPASPGRLRAVPSLRARFLLRASRAFSAPLRVCACGRGSLPSGARRRMRFLLRGCAVPIRA